MLPTLNKVIIIIIIIIILMYSYVLPHYKKWAF